MLCALTWPAVLAAQPAPAPPTEARAWDAAGLVGALWARPDTPVIDRYGDYWYDTVHAGLVVGRHLSPHFKIEVEVSTSGEGRQRLQDFITVPNVPTLVPVWFDQVTTLRQGSATLVWQFLENQWVHPFVQAGVAADVERVRARMEPQTVFIRDPWLPGSRVDVAVASERETTTTTARLVIGGGAKMYVTERAFVRTDARYAGGARGHHVVVRVGAGVDF